MSYIDVTGKTEDEALRKGLEQLGMERDDVSVTILERAKSGFLGIGAVPARIRITYGPEEAAVEEPVAAAPRIIPEKPVEKAAAPAPKTEKPAAPRQEKPRQNDRPRNNDRPAAAKPRQDSRPPRADRAPAKMPNIHREDELSVQSMNYPEVDDDNAKRIIAFVGGLLEHMNSKAEIKVYEMEKGRYKVLLVGERLGQLIGHRGETLDAIQQLTNYAINTTTEKRIRVQLDAENYRARREQSLVSLAQKVAAKVKKYRRSVTLEPMNAYERHVIHAALQDVRGVTTYSVGTEPNRRVVVAFDRSEPR